MTGNHGVLGEWDTSRGRDLWLSFRARWPRESLSAMTLEEYTNLDKKDSFTYWVEAKLEDLGSIWGHSSFKFGIYRRADRAKKVSDGKYCYTKDYAWRKVFGDELESAFAAVREAVVSVATAAAAGDFESIEENPLTPLYKWKLAFLYQDMERARIVPIFSGKALREVYRQHIDPSARGEVARHVEYATLRDRFQEVADPIELGRDLWKGLPQAAVEPEYWACDLGRAMTKKEALALVALPKVGPGVVPADVADWVSSNEDVEAKHHLALIVEGRVRARAVITDANDAVAWTQEPVDLPWQGLALPAGVSRVDARWVPTIWKSDTVHPPAPVALPAGEPPSPRNIILYGPPGTGKTYATIRRALRLVLGDHRIDGWTDDTCSKQFRQLQQDGRIEFVTFHQAYGYEEFVQGLRPTLGERGAGEVDYELHDGVLAKIALRAAGAAMNTHGEEPSFDTLWSELVARIRAQEGRYFESASGNEYVLRVSTKENIAAHRVRRAEGDDEDVIDEEKHQNASRALASLWWENRAEVGAPKDMNYERMAALLARHRGGLGGHHYAPMWIVYRELLALRDELVSRRTGSTPAVEDVRAVLSRPTPGKVDFTFGPTTPQYVLIIDEINRGNVSKVLGELITLLEPDKRLGMPNELKLPLAYSPAQKFAVPPNLHIVATMNTADRSIALMDVALRRRFEFEEVMPDAKALRAVLDGAAVHAALAEVVVAVLDTLNARVRFLYDRDHQIGHAYFMGVRDLEGLRRVIVERIVPLLQEYFYGRWDKVAAVLGCPYDQEGRPLRASVRSGPRYEAPIVEAVVATARAVLGYASEDDEDLVEYRVTPRLTQPGLAKAELALYVLGILELDPVERGTLAKRLAELV